MPNVISSEIRYDNKVQLEQAYHRMAMTMIYTPATIRVSFWVAFGVREAFELLMKSSFALLRDSRSTCAAMDIIGGKWAFFSWLCAFLS